MTFPEPVIEVAIEPKTKADQDKLAIALQRLAEEDPTFRVKTDAGDRPDAHRGHGRAAPRRPRRPHGARVQGRRQRRQAAGLLSRDHPPAGRRATAASSARPAAAASTATPSSGSSPARRAAATSSSTRSSAASSRASTSRRWTPGIREALETGVLRRLPHGRREGHALRRLVPRGRLVGDGLQDRRARWPSRTPSRRPTRPSSSRSCASRWSCPRSSWATSSATSTAAAVTSRAWTAGPAPRSSGHSCPLAAMFGYVTDLRSMSQGRATSSMEFSHYAEVPAGIATELAQKSKV